MEQQQQSEQAPVSAPVMDAGSETVLPTRFVQTSGADVPTANEQSNHQQMMYTPAQLLTVSGALFITQ